MVLDPKDFMNPGKCYRSSPFWSWNNRLDVDELRWQVREFADKGFGGYFMHSRVGLATPYLSPEWMECIRVCLEEGGRVDLESWLYDEDKWPSGFAGGLVPARSDEYRAKYLLMEEVKTDSIADSLNDPNTLGVFEIVFSSLRNMGAFKRLEKPEDFKGKGKILAFKVMVVEHNNWFNGESYVDLLDPETTEEFLKVTVDAYAERFKEDFGEFMPGIFTDEPNYVGGNFIPWTPELPKYFRDLNGYNIIDFLPLLYFEGEGSTKVRCDFWKTVTQRFIESFTKPYSERCGSLGLIMTGHYLFEDDLIAQTRHIGAAMPHYEYMQAPGIDHLGRNIENPLTLKQCSSVAHQFGRRRVLSELFGCSGHSMTFEDQKWIADFHFALGITFLCPHLTLYTMKGDGKRDYPPTFSYHQPYWEHFKLLNDYFARASYVCSQGEAYANILLLHPIGSVWATFSPYAFDRDSPSWRYNNEFVKVLDDLLALHMDFDLGDEVIISRHASIDGKELVIGECRYKVIIVPPSLTWMANTVKLIRKFLDSGGKVLFLSETPKLIGGEDGEAVWREITLHPNSLIVKADRASLNEALSTLLQRTISITNKEGREVGDILVNHRVDGAYQIYFLANKSRKEKYEATITFPETGEVTEWNLFDGSIRLVNAANQNGKTVIETLFHPAGSRVFVIDTSKTPRVKFLSSKKEGGEEVLKHIDEWGFERLHLNSMVLDFCQYSFGDEEWSEKTPIWKVRRIVWKEAGLEKYVGIQPWVLITKGVKPSKPINLRILTKFKSEVKPGKIFLVVEKAQIWRLLINGTVVNTDVKDWYWDKQFSKIDISKYVKIGENTIELSCSYDSISIPIEDMYLVGDFGVKKISETEYTITDEPNMLRSGDWVLQGYPFYAGTMRYKAEFTVKEKSDTDERVIIRLPEAKGSLFLIKVNDGKPIPLCWQPLEVDVTDYVRIGLNNLTIDVVSSLRNTFGPLHSKLGDPYMVGPYTFIDEKNWTDSYQLTPYGLINGVDVIIRRGKQVNT